MVNVSSYRPRPGLTVIPPGWEQHHKPVADGTRTATVELWTGPLAGDPEWIWDRAERREVRNHGTRLHPDSTITARVQRLREEDGTSAGQQDVTTRRYLVALDRDLADELTVTARVRVVDCDPYLDGHYLSVLDIQGGSLRFERDLLCLDNLG